MTRLHTPEQFKTRSARMWMGASGLMLAYLLVSRALDTGSIWQYSGALLLVVLSVRLIKRAHKAK